MVLSYHKSEATVDVHYEYLVQATEKLSGKLRSFYITIIAEISDNCPTHLLPIGLTCVPLDDEKLRELTEDEAQKYLAYLL